MPVKISDKQNKDAALTFIGTATMYDKLPSLVSMKAFWENKIKQTKYIKTTRKSKVLA